MNICLFKKNERTNKEERTHTSAQLLKCARERTKVKCFLFQEWLSGKSRYHYVHTHTHTLEVQYMRLLKMN